VVGTGGAVRPFTLCLSAQGVPVSGGNFDSVDRRGLSFGLPGSRGHVGNDANERANAN
jgi:hypothetical protein